MIDESFHIPVLTEEVIEFLLIKKNGTFLDVTSGFGGHSAAILEELNGGSLIATDQDPEAIRFLKSKFKTEKRISIHQARFSELHKLFSANDFDGILADIGVSSYQLDTAERGFSFMKDGPLDMRMNQNIGEDASSW
jgi:Predicted S-adenosylmethionine-dependent methyltransferase involved in cell envelope biogenesis